MAATWAVSQMDRQTSDDGVTTVHWTVTDNEVVGAGDDAVTHHGRSYGSHSYTPDTIKAGYIAYASLTEANAVAWVKASLGADSVTATEASIAAQIADSKAPAYAQGLPW